jgi:N-acetylglucosamine PTS system EIICBA or EIICB component
VVHALLTGAAMVVMHVIGCHLGFGFSAGLFDYLLNFGKATHPLYLLPVGAAYFAIYYFAFRYAIVRFGLATPGREREEVAAAPAASDGTSRAGGFVAALGGAANLAEVEACTTRLRLVLRDRARVDAAALRALGSRGMIEVGADGLQVVVGPIADQVASEIRAHLAGTQARASLPDANALASSLGGAGNVASVEVAAGRVLVAVKDRARVDARSLQALLERGAGWGAGSTVHLLHADPQALATGLRTQLGIGA